MPDPSTRLQILVTVGVLFVALTAGVWYGLQQPQPAPVVPQAPEAAPEANDTVTVYVSGAVQAAGLVLVPTGSRVADAVAAAGGALPSADLGALNLAAVVRESEHVIVPEVGARPRGSGAMGGGVDLNLASAGELEHLPGVGPVLAARIVAYRDAHGPFGEVEDLLDVAGIGEAKLAQMRDGISRP